MISHWRTCNGERNVETSGKTPNECHGDNNNNNNNNTIKKDEHKKIAGCIKCKGITRHLSKYLCCIFHIGSGVLHTINNWIIFVARKSYQIWVAPHKTNRNANANRCPESACACAWARANRAQIHINANRWTFFFLSACVLLSSFVVIGLGDNVQERIEHTTTNRFLAAVRFIK